MTDDKTDSQMHTLPDGQTEISPSAIATIAAHTVVRSYGVVGMAAKNVVSGIAGAVTGDPHRGIEVRLNSTSIEIDLYVIIEYGTRISSVAKSAAHAVRFNVEKMTGIPVTKVNVFVQGLRVSNSD